MNSMMDPKPRSLHISSSVLRLAAITLLTASAVVGQRVYPSNSNNSNNSNRGKRNHIATIHSADSSEGSRVSISSDQSLADYEAYRRGDRFYVKIPAADVPRAEAVRGRGFADVSAQRSGSSTTLAFRLQPGSTAHVQQNGNRLDVVIAVAGNNTPGSFSRPRNFQWSDTSGVRPANSNSNNRVLPSRDTFDSNANKRGNQNANKNSSARDNASSAANSNSKFKPGNTNSSTASNNPANTNSSAGSKSGNSNSSVGSASAATSPLASPSATASAKPNTNAAGPQGAASPANSVSPSPAAAPVAARSDFWTRAKERGRYWLLLAQLNPIPVAIGAAILVLIIALLLMQRRRAKATRRVKTVTKSSSQAAAVPAATSVAAAVPVVAAATAAEPDNKGEEVTETTRLADVPPVIPAGENGRKERVSRAAEEANKVFAGQPYDESIVGSDDRETRRMVGAELLSAMVGRNTERRERARAAFMKHGYFDDATRDLRVAGSDNERAAAARRLSFVQDPEATPHLVGALSDSSPDVRRAAVEALMDQRDPAAIPALNNLLQSEHDRKVPRHLIEQAIEACATNSAPPAMSAVPSAPPPIDTDREVIEI